jgi:DNA-binding HxlR family transcriptional regulator
MEGSYGQFCPVALAAEVVTRRWMPLVVRELLCGSQRFNDIHRGVPRMSRSLLVRRLAELEEAGLVNSAPGPDGHARYLLTPAGEELRPIIVQLGFWGKRWVQRELARDQLDPGLLMWDMHRRIVREALPQRRTIVRFGISPSPATCAPSPRCGWAS